MKIRLRRVLHTILATAALALASTSHAEVTRWRVDLDFPYSSESADASGNGLGLGIFDYDDSLNRITNWNITTFSDWSKPIPGADIGGYNYTQASSTLDLSNGSFRFLRNDQPQDLGNYMGNFLELYIPSVNSDGSFTGYAEEHVLSETDYSKRQYGFASYTWLGNVGGGLSGAGMTPVAAPVPEPETVGMLLLGLGLVGVAARRKQRAG